MSSEPIPSPGPAPDGANSALGDALAHSETYVTHLGTRLHLTDHASLLDQLREAAVPGAAGEGATGRSGYGSRPACRLGAVDRLRSIETGVRELLAWAGQPSRGTVEAGLRGLVGVATTLDDAELHDLAATVTTWWVGARLATGWDTPPWRPNVACPACGHRGGLRVRLADHVAGCRACDATWTPETIGLLADHVRRETEGRGDRAD